MTETTVCRIYGHKWIDSDDFRVEGSPVLPGVYHCDRCSCILTISKNEDRHYSY